MRFRVVSTRSEIDSLSPNEKLIHLAFRASNVDMLKLVQKCPRLRAVQVPHSYKKTMSDAITVFLDMQGIEVLEGDVWGHRKDLDEYFTIQENVVKDIRVMFDEGVAFEDVMENVRKTARLGPDLVKFIAKTNITA